jgi:hypothetical protein
MPAPELYSAQTEYGGNPVPIAVPQLYAAQTEYGGNPVPIAVPQLYSLQLEYKFVNEVEKNYSGSIVVFAPTVDRTFTGSVHSFTQSSGFLDNGTPTNTLSRAAIANTDVTFRLVATEVLGYAAVSGNPEFSSETSWRYLVAQYKHNASGEIKNIIIRKISGNWDGVIKFTAVAPTGTWTKRSIMLKANDGAELILLPTTFVPSENLTLNA